MAISRFAASRLTQGLPKYQSAWDQDNVQQGAIVPIASATGTGTTNGEQFVFSNIPQIYQDLIVVVIGTQSNTTGSSTLGINGIGGTPYSQTLLNGDGATAASSRLSNTNPACQVIHGSTTAPVIQTHHLLDYTNTTRNKTILSKTSHDKNGSGIFALITSLARTTSAITSVVISTNQGGCFWNTDTRVNLYGVKAGA